MWVNAGIGPNEHGHLVKHPGELWLRDSLDYKEKPRRVLLALNMSCDRATGAVTKDCPLAQYAAGYVKLMSDKRFQVNDCSYEEAYKMLPLDKRIDLWKSCVKEGGLRFDQYAGVYFKPSKEECPALYK